MGVWRVVNLRPGSEEDDHSVGVVLAVVSLENAVCWGNDYSHKRMRKPHFTPINDAISHTFYQCKDIVVLWV